MYRPHHTSITETLFRSVQKLATCPPACIYESNRAGLSDILRISRNGREQLLPDREMSGLWFVIQYSIQGLSLLVDVVSVLAISGLRQVVSQLAHLPLQIS
jgi:hypothetical protein